MESKQQKSIHDLQLHESMIIASHSGMYANEQTSVRRVPGGWIYSTYHSFGKENSGTSKSESSVFVPFSNEFIEDLVVNISADKL